MRKKLVLAATALAASTMLLADTDDHVRQSIPVESAKRLHLEMDFGSIQVETAATSTVQFDVEFRGTPPSRKEFERMLEDFKLQVDRQGDTLRVLGIFKDGWKTGSGGFHTICHDGKCLEYARWLRQMNARVTVPTQFSADLHTRGGSITVGDLKGEVAASTSGGSLHFGRIDGPVHGDTAGGSITLASSRGPAVLRTAGGEIHIQEVSGDVEAHTSGGSIAIERTTGRVVAHTSGGSIHVGKAQGEVDAQTSGGSIEVAMVATAAFTVDAATSGGGVSSDFLVTGTSRRMTLRGTVNGGGPPLRLRTSGGSIHIRRAV